MNHNIPIQSLVFFEATARYKSFTKAAEELCVTQSAVSKQVKNLELFFDRPLFERKYHEIELTHEGSDLFIKIQPLINEIKQAIMSLKNKNNSKTVNIICTHAVAHYYLFPKIVLFNQVNPDITINIISTNTITEKDCLENDFGILYGNAEFPKLHSIKLFEEEIYPIASTKYEFPLINDPSDLLNLKLLQLDPKKWRWMNWKTWFKHFNIVYEAPSNLPVYNQVTLALNASSLGLGVTLGWNFIAKDLIKQNLLKKVGNFTFKTGYSDYLVYSQSKSLSYAAEIFKTWLLENTE